MKGFKKKNDFQFKDSHLKGLNLEGFVLIGFNSKGISEGIQFEGNF